MTCCPAWTALTERAGPTSTPLRVISPGPLEPDGPVTANGQADVTLTGIDVAPTPNDTARVPVAVEVARAMAAAAGVALSDRKDNVMTMEAIAGCTLVTRPGRLQGAPVRPDGDPTETISCPPACDLTEP